VSHWAEIFLGIIAFATLTTSVILVALLVAAGRLARKLEGVVDRLEHDIKPILGHVQAIARDTARAASVASAQVDRAERLFSDVARRVDDTMNTFQQVLTAPMRGGAPLAAALTTFRTVFGLVRDFRAGRARARAEEDDALFI
jgi:hypothetical protein